MPQPTRDDLNDAVIRLGLQLDGDPFRSLSSLVCLVTHEGRPAFLKVTNQPEELIGVWALEQWDGNGAVRVLVRDGNAIVLERAEQTLRSLVTDDASATQVLCDAAQRLHANRPKDLDGFPTLQTWFSSLFGDKTPRFDQVRVIADRLLEHSTPPVLLHGDLHHENVLNGENRGWLAIDPKGILGAREFDYCNIFTNWTPQEAIGHFDARLDLVARVASIDPIDLLRWIASWSALSGIWHLEDGDEASAAFPHSITEIALDRLRVHDA
jgi:streptomycin 6-kinase